MEGHTGGSDAPFFSLGNGRQICEFCWLESFFEVTKNNDFYLRLMFCLSNRQTRPGTQLPQSCAGGQGP